MSSRIYDNGVLLQEWDDVTRIYRRWSTAGVLLEERAYNAGEIAGIVGSGGIIQTTRNLSVTADGGTEIFRIGGMAQGDRGVAITRESGVPAFELRKPFSPADQQQVYIFDADGNQIFAETIFGTGLERPYLSMPLDPIGGTLAVGPFGLEQATTSGTFVDLFRWQGARQNQWYRPVLNVRCSLADTAAEVRIINAAGTVLTPFLAGGWVATAAAGVTTDREVVPPGGLELTTAYGSDQVIRVQARRTAGTGTVTVSVKKSEGGNA